MTAFWHAAVSLAALSVGLMSLDLWLVRVALVGR